MSWVLWLCTAIYTNGLQCCWEAYPQPSRDACFAEVDRIMENTRVRPFGIACGPMLEEHVRALPTAAR